MLVASKRGWGSGWPRNRSSDMRTVTAPRSGVALPVHKGIAVILSNALRQLENGGFLLDYGKRDVNDDWAYNNRPIRGTRVPSNHSWGLAIDINAQDYPQGQRRKVPPRWVIDVFDFYGFDWGGLWGYADPMHFEYRGTIRDALLLTQRLIKLPVVALAEPVVVDASTAPMPEPSEMQVLAFLLATAKTHTYKQGMSGDGIKFVQARLNSLSGTNVVVDGNFGPTTHRAVVNLQRFTGLTPDGVVGPATWKVLYP